MRHFPVRASSQGIAPGNDSWGATDRDTKRGGGTIELAAAAAAAAVLAATGPTVSNLGKLGALYQFRVQKCISVVDVEMWKALVSCMLHTCTAVRPTSKSFLALDAIVD